MSRSTTLLDDRLYEYFLEVSLRHDDLHRRLRDETAELEKADMQISPEQGQFLTLLVGAMNAKLALELGTFTGYSALCIAEGLAEDGKLIACDIDEEWPSFGRRYWAEAGVGHKVDFRAGLAADTMAQLIAEGMEGDFDFVFIDADKRGLEEYYEKMGSQVPMGRYGTAEEFANMACFLASDAGSYITGTAINVDGNRCPTV